MIERALQRRHDGVEPRLRGFPRGAGGDALGGRIGVTTTISSCTLSKTTITVGRIRIASGTPIWSGFVGGSRSIWRTMS